MTQRKRQKALREAVDAALAAMLADLHERFPEFDADEVTLAISKAVGPWRQRLIDEARRREYAQQPVDPASHSAIERWIDARYQEAQANKIAAEIADAGYRALAKKHHPDAGGSHDDMTRLNRGRDRLKRLTR